MKKTIQTIKPSAKVRAISRRTIAVSFSQNLGNSITRLSNDMYTRIIKEAMNGRQQ